MEQQTGILSIQIDNALPKSENDSYILTEMGKYFYLCIKLGVIISGISILYLCLHIVKIFKILKYKTLFI
jgi:hypothetical protein